MIELKVATANASLAQQFEGKYIHLSMQKFSSNVVEKCLKVFKEADKTNIILELLSAPQFERLLLHPYANYVVYAALQNSKVNNISTNTESTRDRSVLTICLCLRSTEPFCWCDCDEFFRGLSTQHWPTPSGLMWNYSEPAHTARGSTLELCWRSDGLMKPSHHVTIKIVCLVLFFQIQKG